jgi:glucose/arabinose dehydrogenase
MNRKTVFTVLGIALAVLLVLALVFRDDLAQRYFRPTDSNIENGVTQSRERIEVVAQDLTVPWEVTFLPGGDMLVTERSGTLKRIGQNEQEFEIEGVRHVGEGGLLGMALHPDFEENRWLYLYLTTRNASGLTNRVERYELANDRLTGREEVIADIPGASNHDGGRIAFGPDSLLYITTGDAGQPDLAQDTSSLAGKILRLGDSGDIPAGNPFNNAVYSYGHRNPQGIAWDGEGRLWSTEHGRSGVRSGLDELNLIEAGANYGWPVIEGDETREGMKTPIVHSGSRETWAPAGLAYHDGSLYFAGLRGQTLYEAQVVNGSEVNLRAHFRNEYGRLRAVVLGPENQLYVTTSNTDGRGSIQKNDDKILLISPNIFR